ncbi:hypothetical protein BCR36DRAFT_375015 [Piromyces finnis]|uniref:Uncharacterized protein n=1 Tax=Piromyces finnis TaxID=1754191 RepID=A0A1Y1UX61_9FUNG|nr:hypothetical protein BCR36DRAFT_375015 [Piromyces finnis]|eukprot:ORX41810.1 hypothetical protein BCR36DRAFT_375015 [Piromyces finnis]
MINAFITEFVKDRDNIRLLYFLYSLPNYIILYIHIDSTLLINEKDEESRKRQVDLKVAFILFMTYIPCMIIVCSLKGHKYILIIALTPANHFVVLLINGKSVVILGLSPPPSKFKGNTPIF